VNVGITCYPTYGGSGIVATELGLELAARGHEVHLISYASPIRLDTSTPRIHYHASEVAESYNLDVLHVHYAIPHSISALLARRCDGIPNRPNSPS
jgi:glycosyltransferase involved in cell wall biosynthesis